jgi:FtsZ-interacting cell division protein ZipA
MEPQKSSVGGIIGTIIIIALIVLGGLYFWGKRIEESRAKQDLVSEGNDTQQVEMSEADNIRNTNASDDINAIEADLNATNLNNLDSELNVVAE